MKQNILRTLVNARITITQDADIRAFLQKLNDASDQKFSLQDFFEILLYLGLKSLTADPNPFKRTLLASLELQEANIIAYRKLLEESSK